MCNCSGVYSGRAVRRPPSPFEADELKIVDGRRDDIMIGPFIPLSRWNFKTKSVKRHFKNIDYLKYTRFSSILEFSESVTYNQDILYLISDHHIMFGLFWIILGKTGNDSETLKCFFRIKTANVSINERTVWRTHPDWPDRNDFQMFFHSRTIELT